MFSTPLNFPRAEGLDLKSGRADFSGKETQAPPYHQVAQQSRMQPSTAVASPPFLRASRSQISDQFPLRGVPTIDG